MEEAKEGKETAASGQRASLANWARINPARLTITESKLNECILRLSHPRFGGSVSRRIVVGDISWVVAFVGRVIVINFLWLIT